MSDVLQQLAATIAERRRADPEQSYVASLHHKGLNKILEKVGEEATEVILRQKTAVGRPETRSWSEKWRTYGFTAW